MKPLVKEGPHEIKEELRDGEQFAMFDPRVMAAFRLGDGLRFDLARPRGGLMYWCFLRYSNMRHYFMGEIPEGQGNIERLHGKSLKGRKAY